MNTSSSSTWYPRLVLCHRHGLAGADCQFLLQEAPGVSDGAKHQLAGGNHLLSSFIFGIVYFVLIPGLKSGSMKGTLLRAALYGLITYATYDLTNLATLKDWPSCACPSWI